MSAAASVRVLDPYVGAQEVKEALSCSLSAAYGFLREAAGRKPGEKGMLRVRASTWNAFAKRRFEGGKLEGQKEERTEEEVPSSAQVPRVRLVASDGHRVDLRPTAPRRKLTRMKEEESR